MLRDYQTQIINGVRQALREGSKHPLVVAPTGSGKTHIAAHIIRACQEKSKQTLFLAPRRELIYQAYGKFEEYGIKAGMIMAGEPRSIYARNQVASFDTLYSRGIKREVIVMPPAQYVIVDEAHLSLTKAKQKLLDYYKDAIVIGLTATPARADGAGMGEFYDRIVNPVTTRDLMDQGYLVRARYFAPTKFDLKGVKQTRADYIVSSLEKAVDKPKLIGDIFDNWKRLAWDKRTVVFCTTCKHSRHVRDLFRSKGISAAHVDGETPTAERKEIFDKVRSGEIQVICNVYVCSLGLDIPPLECAVMARPTKSSVLWLQTIGRILRTSPNKDDAIVIDHTGAVELHGFVDQYYPWSLDGKNIREAKIKRDKENKEPSEIICRECNAVFSGSRVCPDCGTELIPSSKPIPCKKADLVEVKKSLNKNHTPEQKAEFYGMLKQYGLDKGYKDGWSSNKYREKFGVWPNKYKNVEKLLPNLEVMNWIRSRNIAYHYGSKRREKT